MSMQNLNDAAGAQNALTARMNAFLNTIDADISTRQAAYAALADNLTGIVSSQMYFTGLVDPDEAAPTNIDGGTFNNVADLVNAAPCGAYILCVLAEGKNHVITPVPVFNKSVDIYPQSTNVPTSLSINATATSTHNNVQGFYCYGNSSVKIRNLNVNLPVAKAVPALPWSSTNTMMSFTQSESQRLMLLNCTVTGGAGVGLIRATPGAAAFLGLEIVTLNGPFQAVTEAGQGIALISQHVVTLTNGAVIQTGGLLGTDLLIGS